MKLLNEIVSFLDSILPPDHPADASINGLQVANDGQVNRIYTAVDASWETLRLGPNVDHALFVVHHGLFWRKQDLRVTEVMYRKLAYMLHHNIALYASHLPLDQHPLYGNNAVLLQKLGIEASTFQSFGSYHGCSLGYWADFKQAISMQEFLGKVKQFSPLPFQFYQGSNNMIKRIAVVTGDGCDFITEAKQIQTDLFITGEFSHQSYTYCQDNELNMLYLSHYGSEKWGVIKIGELLTKTFALESVFLDAYPKTTWVHSQEI
jgi:dinuclear metal center YbgI/SA1388 family protein